MAMVYRPVTFHPHRIDPEAPVGRYVAEVTAARYRMSAAGNPIVALTLKLVEMCPPLDSAGVGEVLTDYLVFTGRALWRAHLFTRAIKIAMPMAITPRALEEWAATLSDARCIVEVEHEDDARNGMRAVVRRYVRD
jgi:hypothetical protein